MKELKKMKSHQYRNQKERKREGNSLTQWTSSTSRATQRDSARKRMRVLEEGEEEGGEALAEVLGEKVDGMGHLGEVLAAEEGKKIDIPIREVIGAGAEAEGEEEGQEEVEVYEQ